MLKIDKSRIIYNEIKEFLYKHFSDNFNESKEYEECFLITIYSQENEDSPVWFEYDIGNSELIVGYGISHIHYGEQYEKKILEGLNQLLVFFTTKMRRLDYYKGNINFRNVYEIKRENGTYKNLGTSSMLFIYPFWKKTTIKVTEYSELIKDLSIKIELEELRDRINKVYKLN